MPDTVAYSIHEAEISVNANIFPNPVSQSAEISFNVSPCDFDLFNSAGQKVFSQKNISESFLFMRNDLAPGIYLYEVSVRGAKMKTGKIILL